MWEIFILESFSHFLYRQSVGTTLTLVVILVHQYSSLGQQKFGSGIDQETYIEWGIPSYLSFLHYMLFPLPLSITMWPEMLDFYGENANDFLNLPLHLGMSHMIFIKTLMN